MIYSILTFEPAEIGTKVGFSRIYGPGQWSHLPVESAHRREERYFQQQGGDGSTIFILQRSLLSDDDLRQRPQTLWRRDALLEVVRIGSDVGKARQRFRLGLGRRSGIGERLDENLDAVRADNRVLRERGRER